VVTKLYITSRYFSITNYATLSVRALRLDLNVLAHQLLKTSESKSVPESLSGNPKIDNPKIENPMSESKNARQGIDCRV